MDCSEHSIGWIRSRLALPAVAIVGNWQQIGYVTIIFLAGLTGVPPHLLDTSRVDGAGPLRSFIHVTWPALEPAALLAIVITTINSLRVYDTVRLMSNGGRADSTATLTFELWRRGVYYQDIGGAAVLALVLLLVTLLITIAQMRGLADRLGSGLTY